MTDIRRSLLRGMSSIVGDLYGEPAKQNTATYKTVDTPGPANPPALPAFTQLWKTADETIDWTDILISPTPTDGLTPPEKWAFLHQHASDVLMGDVAAYLAVLQQENPMADLMPYVTALDVTCANADTLRVTFSSRRDLHGEEYLCGMAVRIARDLFAALPVLQVEVSAQDALAVTFTRAQMNKVRFAFIDPAEFVKKCIKEDPSCSAN